MAVMDDNDLELNHHLSIVLSNLSEQTVDRILRAQTVKSLRELVRESFYEHPPGCRGGYSEERCPCAVVPKGFHTLMVVTVMVEAKFAAMVAR